MGIEGAKTKAVGGVLFNPWVWKMAWRDTRRGRRHLLLYSTSIILGIAVFVAIGSFRRQLETAMQAQARTLVGADLVLGARDPFTPEQLDFIRSLGGEQAREVNFTSMVLSESSQRSRLAQIRAIEGGFPFYGRIETVPSDAADRYQADGRVLAEASLLAQLEAQPGDSLKLGDAVFPIGGELRKVPGENAVFSSIAPRVYVAYDRIQQTKLLGERSLARFRVYFKFDPLVNVEALVARHRSKLEQWSMDWDTVEKRKSSLGRSVENLYQFLNLCGFVSVLLGAIGIASAIQVHVREKLATIAVLRCLGASRRQAFAIYLIQACGVGLAGALGGAVLGVAVQAILPMFTKGLLTLESEFAISWAAVAQGMALGTGVCLAFALGPLSTVRRVSPLSAIRLASGVEAPSAVGRWLTGAASLMMIILAVVGVASPGKRLLSLGYVGGLAAGLGVLAGVSFALIRLLRGRIPAALPFVIRQGVANLYRPNNRTVLLTVALGAGAFFILVITQIQSSVMRQLSTSDARSQGNTILFDVQPDQVRPLTELLRARQLAVIEDAPLVTMRLKSFKGRTTTEWKRDKSSQIPGWALNREYRSSYREQLADSETLLAGAWHPKVAPNPAEVPVSIEDGLAKSLHLGLGDEVVFDVQGLELTTKVASIREVDWKRMKPGFFFLFPTGVLEDAPAFHLLVTRVESRAQSDAFQRDLIVQFPNVSVIDLNLILQTVNSVLDKIGVVVRFMAFFLAGTGLFVLVAVVATGRYQRARESVLLRTLGASRRQVRWIFLTEYLFLGILASATAVGLALPASWAVAVYGFKIAFVPSWSAMAGVVAVSCAATAAAGFVLNRGVSNQSPLEILRSEA